ncbi:MAG: ATP-binding protein [Xenococcaceae cyanobacterium]
MVVNTKIFFNACNPTKPIDIADDLERKYYIDFSKVRGPVIIDEMERKIKLSDRGKTCQLFTGHIGCGKSTELSVLKNRLENEGFSVIYIQAASKDSNLDLSDMSVTDLLLLMARRIIQTQEKNGIRKISEFNFFKDHLHHLGELLQTPIDIEVALSTGIFTITGKTKGDDQARRRLRDYLEPRIDAIVKAINEQIIKGTTDKLKKRGKQGLVLIVDDLDRLRSTVSERLFIGGNKKLAGLDCHIIYTIPLERTYSPKGATTIQRLGDGMDPKVLPLVSVMQPDRTPNQEGMLSLQQMILARAFPELEPEDRIQQLSEIFDTTNPTNTLNRLCQISGGHVRNLLSFIVSCLQREDLPISRQCLESVIQEKRQNLSKRVTDDEWDLIFKVLERRSVTGEEECQRLFPPLFILEYRDNQGKQWFDINPLLGETLKFKSWWEKQSKVKVTVQGGVKHETGMVQNRVTLETGRRGDTGGGDKVLKVPQTNTRKYYLATNHIEPCHETDDTKAYAIARIKDHQSGQPFYLGRIYELQAGIRSQIPSGFKGEPVQLPDQQEAIQLEIVVWAEDMEIEPAWMQPYFFSRTEETALAEFQLKPTQSGHKQVRVEFLYQRHWLAKIEFEVEVVEAQELVPVS